MSARSSDDLLGTLSEQRDVESVNDAVSVRVVIGHDPGVGVVSDPPI